MTRLMRCPYCGLLQDEPAGAKSCSRCGGGLEFEKKPSSGKDAAYIQVEMELDQVAAPAGQNVERYLLVTIRTPQEVPPGQAAPPGKKRPALNVTPVLDTSGSMRGQKINQARQAVSLAVRTLADGDVFSLVTFSSDVMIPFEPAEFNPGLVARVEKVLQDINGTGSTALCSGLETGIKNAAAYKKDTNLVLLLSDGEANVGEIDLEKIGQRALDARQQGMIVSTLGVGLDYNEALMSEIATQGGGRFYHVENTARIPAYVAGELGEVAALAARAAEIHLDIPEGATLVPLSAAYPVRQAGRQAVVSVGELPCGMELEIPLRLALLAQKPGTKISLEGILKFISPAGHSLQAPINRVTIRFLKQSVFQLREGMVLPVAERVFTQLKAASILNISRTRATRVAETGQRTREAIQELHTYANLLGEDRAEHERSDFMAEMNQIAASSSTAKQASARSYRLQRGSKDFDH